MLPFVPESLLEDEQSPGNSEEAAPDKLVAENFAELPVEFVESHP
jgi:hypothetical protein